MLEKIKNELSTIVEGNMICGAPLAPYTTFRIGGISDVLLIPKDMVDLRRIMLFLRRHKLDYKVLGYGSNLLVSDNGVKQVIINLTKSSYFKNIVVQKNKLKCFAGAGLASVLKTAMDNNLGGLEFLTHIPGSIGGALYMNAGAFGREIGSFVDEIEVIDRKGVVRTYKKEKLRFGYRRGIQDKFIVSVVLKLKNKSAELIKEIMESYQQKRKSVQPSGWSAGSVFKNGDDYTAGQVIDSVGLKGVSVNDAYVSKKHANFIINKGHATAKDVCQLITFIKEEVFQKKHISLEPEIQFVGEF